MVGGKREGAGRKNLFEKAKKIGVLLPDSVVEKLGAKPATKAREIILEWERKNAGSD